MSAEQQHEQTDAGHVLGIDVGWSEKTNTTGACLLSWDQGGIELEVHHLPTDSTRRHDKLLEIVGTKKFLAVALDGPMRRGFDRIGEYRLGEVLLTRRFGNAGYGKPGQSHSGNGILLNHHANEIANSVKEANCVDGAAHHAAIDRLSIVEAFPTTFLAVMLDADRRPSSKAKSDIFYEWLLGPDSPARHVPDENRIYKLISGLLGGRKINSSLESFTDHEHRAAVICAATALCVARKQYVAVGDSRNGYIILPPRSSHIGVGLENWAFTMIENNLKARKDWKKDKLSVAPPAPHMIIETPNEVRQQNADYRK